MSKTAGRKRTGHLYEVKSGWRARITIEKDGVPVQKSVDLETKDKVVARAKLKRLMDQITAGLHPEFISQEAKRVDSFEEAAERIVNASTFITKGRRLERLRRFVYPAFGKKQVTEVVAGDVRDVLNALADKGYSKQQCQHVRNDISSVLGELWSLDVLPENICKKVKIPQHAKVDNRERAVLTDEEFLTYLRWRHPLAKKRRFVLERQVMSCIARVLGGQRWGDVLTTDWTQFDVPDFTRARVARRKTNAPQTLLVPDQVRPLLVLWWKLQGKPTAGLMFPVRKGKRAGKLRTDTSIARDIRIDMKRAFGIEVMGRQVITKANGRTDTKYTWRQAREMTARERELLLPKQPYTRPVDFHSFRRGFKQALASGGIDVQQSMKLSGATDLATHARYLRNTRRVEAIPGAAVPDISTAVADIVSFDESTDAETSLVDAGLDTSADNAQCAAPAQRVRLNGDQCAAFVVKSLARRWQRGAPKPNACIWTMQLSPGRVAWSRLAKNYAVMLSAGAKWRAAATGATVRVQSAALLG